MSNEVKGGNTQATKTAEEAKVSTITVKFEAEDKALHEKILADAKEDDREPNKFLLRFIRKHYPKAGA